MNRKPHHQHFHMILLAIFVPMLAQVAKIVADEPPPLQRTTQIQDGRELGVGRQTPDLTIKPLTGATTTTGKLLDGRAGLVYVMTSTGCPLSRKYAARIASIEKEYAGKVTFVYVNTVSAETADDMRRQIREFGFAGPYAPDLDRKIARALGARTTTEVFVIDAARTLIFRGAVDDQYGVGTSLNQPMRNFLRDALAALVEGERLRTNATWPPGCLLDAPKRDTPTDKNLTYYGRVARILAENCVGCHRLGGVAPFPLDTYPSLTGRVSMIEAVVADELMPPWHGAKPPENGTSLWANDRSLSARDREDLLAWLRSSRPIGRRADAPVPTATSQTWEIGRPDEVLTTLWMDLPAEGPMQYARLLVPTNFDGEKWLSSFEFRPDMHDTIHHALVWLLPPGAVVPAVDKIPADLELLGTYSPGDNVFAGRLGVARRLPRGSILLVDTYARPMGQEMRSRLRIAMRFADRVPETEYRTLVMAANEVEVAANESDATITTEARLTGAARVSAITPYLRARGQRVTIDLAMPDQPVRRLLDAPRYDYRWQIRYELKEPLDLPTGTRIVLTGHYNNGADHPNNPAPGKAASAGIGAADEALMLALELIEPVWE